LEVCSGNGAVADLSIIPRYIRGCRRGSAGMLTDLVTRVFNVEVRGKQSALETPTTFLLSPEIMLPQSESASDTLHSTFSAVGICNRPHYVSYEALCLVISNYSINCYM
jgi:hypothetical protein